MAATLKGDKELMRRLSQLAKQSQLNRVLRPALREASGEVRKRAKFFALASKDTGLLRKSISNVIRTGRSGPYALVGPAHGFATVNPKTGRRQDPVKYAHLVELGTRHSAAKPFLRPAFDSTDTHGIIARRARIELDKLIAKLR